MISILHCKNMDLFSIIQVGKWDKFIDLYSPLNFFEGLNVNKWTTTDELNSIISFLVLGLLKKHNHGLFENLDLTSEYSKNAIKSSPPFRWEKHKYCSVDFNGEVEVVLDVGHNPAAIEAIGQRLQLEYPGRTYK